VQWEVLTVDPSKPYTITGAPRVVGERVIIGNGGAEFGVRGYVAAYAIATGEQIWRTYTVPGDPSQPFESEALARAATTWKGGEWWKIGGGGTVWDSMAYDPALDLLYVGTGNGSPWTRQLRSPGGGDNLYLSSILALRPATGELVWHYQTTPGDTWDFTATQHMILADLTIDGRARPVLMQAPKNGFFYVLDRATGELISAEKYVTVTWASHVDRATGRPVEVPGQDYAEGVAIVQPTPFGGHNWHPMSYSPKTGLVYIPAQDIVGAYRRDPSYAPRDGEFNTGTDFNLFSGLTREAVSGHLLAWDPVRQREVWRQPYALPWNGGTLATAGDLVFQGTSDGRFLAYRATDGEARFEAHVPSGVIAAPVTFARGGRQYVTVVAGFGGAFGLAGGDAATGAKSSPSGHVLTYTLPGEAPTAEEIEVAVTKTGVVHDGERLYHASCARCHGAGAIGTGVLSDLRKMSADVRASFDAIVLGGALEERGMPSYGHLLRPEDTRAILAYLDARGIGVAP
jgi:quinohemoprotein ethanol dehydrogenase